MSLLLPTLLLSALLAPQEEATLNLSDVIDRLEARAFLAEPAGEGEETLRFSGAGSAGPELSEAEVELFAAEGPGILGRLMMVQPAGVLRFYFDGAETPAMEFGAREFFSLQGPFQAPLVALDGSRGVCRAPIPFGTSLRVTSTQASPRFEAGVQLLPKDVVLESASSERFTELKPNLDRVARSVAGSTEPDRWRTAFATGVCDRSFPFEYDINGNGVMQWFSLRFISTERISPEEMAEYMRSMRIEFLEGTRVENMEQLLASVPFGDFFGTAPDIASWRSDVLAIDGAIPSFTARFPMPFKHGFGMRIHSTRKMPKQIRMKLTIGFEQLLEPPAWRFRSGFFQKRGVSAEQGGTIELGKIAGPGRLVGLSLTGLYDGREAWDSGSLLLTADGEALASNQLAMNEVFDRTTRRDGPASFGYTSRNRFWIHDPISFDKSIELAVSLGAAEKAKLSLEGVAYWYAPGPTPSPFVLSEDAELLRPEPTPVAEFELEAGSIEAETMRLDRHLGSGELRTVSSDEFAGAQIAAWNWSGMQDGNFVKLGVPVRGSDHWSVAGRFWAYPGGPTLQLSLSGKALGGNEFSLDAEQAGWKLIEFGQLDLKPREHILLLGVKEAAQDGPGVVFDYLLMRPLKK
jgi:hypothetical protein